MDQATRLRLLPWPSPNGGPAYTPDDSPEGVISRLADELEDRQEQSAQFVLKLSGEMLEMSRDRELTLEESAYIINRLREALADVLRIAESREGRLTLPEESADTTRAEG